MSPMKIIFLKACLILSCLTTGGASAQEALPNIAYDSEPGIPIPNSRYFSVAFIDTAKRLVFINAGAAHGINKGDRVCILDQARIKIGCFRIRIINKTSAAFKPSVKRMPKINSGMVARFAENDEQLDEDFEDNKTSYLEAGLAFSPLLPHTFNKVLFVEDELTTGNINFEKDQILQSNYAQVYLGTQVQFSASLGYATGLITRYFSPLTTASDLGPSFPDLAAVHKYSVVGFGMPFLIRWNYGSGNTQLVLSEGLQWDLSYLNYRLYTKDALDEESLLLKHVSVVNSVSLKAEAGVSFKVGDFSRINSSLGLVLPIIDFGNAYSTEYTEGNTSGGYGLRRESLIDALGHGKSKVGVDILLSVSIGF